MSSGAGMAKVLPDELISLIHHVELNDSGWWKKSTNQIIKSILFDFNHPVSLEEIKSKIKDTFGFYIPEENFDKQIEELINNKKIIKNDNSYFISGSEREVLNRVRLISIENGIKTESLFKKLSVDIGLEYEIDIDSAWLDFKEQVVKSIKTIGANTYNLLNDGTLRRESDWLKYFLSKYPVEFHGKLKKVISNLLDPVNTFSTKYILGILNAYFFVEATQLKKETVKYIEDLKKIKEVKVILDTNFVFSVLGLHDNPSNKSVESIFNLTEKIGGIKIKYYILRKTLEEIDSVISYQLDKIKRYKYSKNLIRAVNVSNEISGVAAKFFSECERLGEELSPDVYFEPYTKGLQFYLATKNIKIMEWDTLHYSTSQPVIDDISRVMERAGKRKREREDKSYEAVLHDMILWHAIKDNRNNSASTALEENCWGVTLDWSLISFDRFKRKYDRNSLPVVMHPNNFIQLMQFWVPRDSSLDSGIMDVMRMPLLIGDFNSEDEKVTLDIITKLSTYRAIGDISVETLAVIITDKALKSRIKESDDSNEEIIDLIDLKFADLANNYKEEADEKNILVRAKENKIKDLEDEMEVKISTIENEKNKEIDRLKKENESLINLRKKTDKKNNILRMRSEIKKDKIFYGVFLFISSFLFFLCNYYTYFYFFDVNQIPIKLEVYQFFIIKLGVMFFITFLIYKIFSRLIKKYVQSYSKCIFTSLFIKYKKILIILITIILSVKDEIIDIVKNNI